MALKNTETANLNATETSEQDLKELFKKTFKKDIENFLPLKGDASARRLFRIQSKERSVLGAIGPDKLENVAFLEFSKHFKKEKMPVPEIYGQDLSKNIYIEEDLGDITLFDFLIKNRTSDDFPKNALECYKRAVDYLPKFQMLSGKTLNYKFCHPRECFDKQSIMWDLNYFKYYFLRLSKIQFNEQKLEDDFNKFADFLLEADKNYFLYRDFQSRNIMIRDNQTWFIDYQGGRKGALQYDIASILYDAKADIPPKTRNELLKYYIETANSISGIDRTNFMQYYYGYVFIRIMQALGAYGLRGFYERKTHFLESVPYAVRNIEHLLQKTELPVKLPELMQTFKKMIRSSYLRQFGETKLKLTIRIQSFSYRNGIPHDEKGHGGGYVFDCRNLPNPGKFEKYAKMNGKDPDVISFLEKETPIRQFMESVYQLIDRTIENYQSRNFTDLLVSFGCTGGLHRSVYCAEILAKHIEKKYKVATEIYHRELKEPQVPLT
jgi:aminoglycoside/choline kinase family phosphotransferase